MQGTCVCKIDEIAVLSFAPFAWTSYNLSRVCACVCVCVCARVRLHLRSMQNHALHDHVLGWRILRTCKHSGNRGVERIRFAWKTVAAPAHGRHQDW